MDDVGSMGVEWWDDLWEIAAVGGHERKVDEVGQRVGVTGTIDKVNGPSEWPVRVADTL